MKRICIVTPCLNSAELIEHTMRSVLNNTLVLNKSIELHYIIKDGNSTDDTVKIANDVFKDFYSFPNVKLTIISEADDGMYDAIYKGFKFIGSGDICCYINAGDYYSPYAFEVVMEIFNTGVSWLTGLECRYNEKNHLIYSKLPYKYRSGLIQKGLYTTVLPVIQQESTFWVGELHQHINFTQLSKMKYAGDYLLWKTFSKYSELYIVNCWLSGFKIHDNQLSALHIHEYQNEVKTICSKPTLSDYLQSYVDKIIWHLPNRIIKIFNHKIFTYNFENQKYQCQDK